jgi:hypothetical protein
MIKMKNLTEDDEEATPDDIMRKTEKEVEVRQEEVASNRSFSKGNCIFFKISKKDLGL